MKKAGYIAIVGRPNVGKSTLLNHLIGQKVSITSRKPQTTRHNILGIKTINDTQLLFLDTPGIHLNSHKAINRAMNKNALAALQAVDVVLFVVDKTNWTDEDSRVLGYLREVSTPVIVIVNKIDQIENKQALLPWLPTLAAKLPKAEIMPLSALHGHNLEQLVSLLESMVPEGDHFYADDQITNKTVRFLAAEIIREKLMRQLGSEVPYQIAVEIQLFEEEDSLVRIEALILVEKEGQKRIIIGDKGSKIKNIGVQARRELEQLLENKVMLNLWVKVKSGWSDSERALKSLGIYDW